MHGPNFPLRICMYLFIRLFKTALSKFAKRYSIYIYLHTKYLHKRYLQKRDICCQVQVIIYFSINKECKMRLVTLTIVWNESSLELEIDFNKKTDNSRYYNWPKVALLFRQNR